MLTVEKVLEELQKHGITNSIQQTRKWIREGRIKAEEYSNGKRSEGYRVSIESLNEFIREERPIYFELLEKYEQLNEDKKQSDQRIGELERELDFLNKHLKTEIKTCNRERSKLDAKIEKQTQQIADLKEQLKEAKKKQPSVRKSKPKIETSSSVQ